MKIYILPVRKDFQPESQSLKYPRHNKDYGVEQDFYKYLLRHSELTVQKPEEADLYYLPIYWNRYYVNHAYGKSGWEELQQEVDRKVVDDRKTFTIYGYSRGPLVKLGRATVFLVSRRTKEGIDIPLLCSPHRVPLFNRIPLLKPSKKYLASFIGRLSTHPIRQEMAKCLENRDDVYISEGNKGTRFFVKKMLESYIALCPRGAGGSSFRFFEAMQLGVVPFLIGDTDTRPFKEFINWDGVSFFSKSVSDLNDRLNSLQPFDLLSMGKRATRLWRQSLTYQKWCRYVIQELEEITDVRQD